jgi:hypothetical protein
MRTHETAVLLVHGREPSTLMKSRRRIAFPTLGTRPSSASNSGCQNRELRPAKWDPKVQLRCGVLGPLTAATGHTRSCRYVRDMSALAPIATDGNRLYSITSSAVASNVAGTVRPSALAVLRLMTRSYLVGAWTGSSFGFAPLRMRSAYDAARRNSSTI